MSVIISDNSNPKYGTAVATAILVNGGSGYTANDVLTLNAGDTNATITVNTVNGSGVILTSTLTTRGSGYAVASAVGVTGGTGTLATFDVTVHAGLSTVNGFYRVEAHNLGFGSLPVSGPIDILNRMAITFANAGNCLGAGFSVASTYKNSDKEITAYLEEIKTTATMTIASPCVVTCNSHGYSGGEKISFSTTGALPTGLIAAQTYFVKYIDINTFNLSLTSGGTNINTSGAQSGTHTIWDIRAEKTKTAATMFGSEQTVGDFVIPFVWSTPYTVDTASSKWSLCLNYGTGSVGAYYWDTVNYPHTTAGLSYFTWCNTACSFNDGDALIIKDTLIIDKTATIDGVASTSGTDYASGAYAITMCSNSTDLAFSSNRKLAWENPPLSSYTLNVNGRITLPNNSGIEIGKIGHEIPYAQKATILGITSSLRINSSGNLSAYYASNCTNISIAGEIPAVRKAAIPTGALGSQKIIVTDVETGWSIGDTVYYGPLDSMGNITFENTIANISGTTITLTNNIASAGIISNAVIINRDAKYGVMIGNFATTTVSYISIWGASNFSISGCAMNKTQIVNGNRVYGVSAALTDMVENVSNTYKSQHYFCDNFLTGGYTLGCQNTNVPSLGLVHSRNYIMYCPVVGLFSTSYTTPLKSGSVVVSDNISIGSASNIYHTSGILGTVKNATISGNKFYNMYSNIYPISTLNGSNITFTDNEFYGNFNGLTSEWCCLKINTVTDSIFARNKFNKNNTAVGLANNSSNINTVFTNEYFGNLSANVYDILVGSNNYNDILFYASITNIVFTTTNYDTAIGGSIIRFQNEANTANKDRCVLPFGNFVRTGDGLADTTVHTSGTDKFAMRFEPTSSSIPLEWEFKIPIGNIQNKTMSVGIWVKINSATYYANTHQKPRLNVNYDNGTTAYAEAIATTSWQLLTVPFTPTTSYGQITITIDGMTDATSTNAYFYVDDFSVFYPPGVQLDLGGMDLWADALPITPPIATNITAADVWNVQASVLTDAGTIGKRVADSLPTSGSIASAVWDYLTSALTTVGSIGKWILDKLDVVVSTRLEGSSYVAPDNAGIAGLPTLLEIEASTVLAKTSDVTSAESNIRGGSETLESLKTAIGNITVDNAAIADAVWDEVKTGHTGSLKTMADNLDITVSSRLATEDYVLPDNIAISGLPTLIEIEASTVLAKEATVESRLAADDYIAPDNAGIDALPLLTEIESSVILAKASEISELSVTLSGQNNVLINILEVANIISKFNTNKMVVLNNQLTVYDDDGDTPLQVFNLLNSAGNPATTDVYQRVPV